MKTLPKVDILIVGMGAAGGIAADVLTAAGHHVVALEAGDRLDSKQFAAQMDELGGWSQRNRLGDKKTNHEIPSWRPNAQSEVRVPPVAMTTMNGTGGSSVHYSAASWRFRPDDFKIRSSTEARYGAAAIPPGTGIVDWPISYEELEPYYDKVEYAIGVSGAGGSNVFEAPRRRDYPMPPLRGSGYTELARQAMRAMGYHPFPQPSAIASQDYDGRPACTYCGFCTGFGCWNDSKSSTLVTSIRRAEASGRLELRSNATVTRILSDDQGRVSGVRYTDAAGEEFEQPAGFVILATFTYENVRRLLLSRSAFYPHGLCNNGGQVGRFYMTHSYVIALGLFPGRDLHNFNGMISQATVMDDFNGDNFDHHGLNFIRGASIAAWNERLPIASADARPPSVPGWGPAYKEWLRSGVRSVGGLVGQLETLPYVSNFMDLDPVQKDPRGDPLLRVTYDLHENEARAAAFLAGKMRGILHKMGASETWMELQGQPLPIYVHAYGGARMGHDPASSVVNSYGIAHEAPNLAILGGSAFPSNTGYNPTQTIQALAWRSAEYIGQNLAKLMV